VRSLSPSSRESQVIAKGDDSSPPFDCSQSVTNVVLPKPAGAEINVSFWFSPRSSCDIKRGLETSSGRVVGIKSFVTKMGEGIRGLYPKRSIDEYQQLSSKVMTDHIQRIDQAVCEDQRPKVTPNRQIRNPKYQTNQANF